MLNTQAEFIQGTPEWLAFRKTKITATDAPIIMGASYFKTRMQLYHEKTSMVEPEKPNARMERGLSLEVMARELFTLKTGITLIPKSDPRNVVVNEHLPWMMASFDGISECGDITVEIKCPGPKDHLTALLNTVPLHYVAQIQHQLEVKKPKKHFYFSFDGFDGHVFEVERDEEYIEKMIEEEKKFYNCMVNKTAPEPSEFDYAERSDFLWRHCALKWKDITDKIKHLEKEEEMVREQLILISGEQSTKGEGILLQQIYRKGNIDYSSIPALRGIDLEAYRKPSSKSWRITAQ